MTPAAATSISRAASAWAAGSRSLDSAMGLRRQSRLRPDAINLVFLALAAGGCHFGAAPPMHPESPAGSWYVVAPGETLETIARRADVPMADLVEINGLADPTDARPGRLIFILASPGAPAPAPGDDAPLPPTTMAAATPLRWPLASGRIIVASPFGTREGRPHE